jgi:hypothetical protein
MEQDHAKRGETTQRVDEDETSVRPADSWRFDNDRIVHRRSSGRSVGVTMAKESSLGGFGACKSLGWRIGRYADARSEGLS